MDVEKCRTMLSTHNISTYADFLKWIRSNHPDKRHDIDLELVQQLTSCSTTYCDKNVKHKKCSLPKSTETIYVDTKDDLYVPIRQCKCKTSSGTRCKLKPLNNSRYCFRHQKCKPSVKKHKVVKRCICLTKSGMRCKNNAIDSSKFCKRHQKCSI